MHASRPPALAAALALCLAPAVLHAENAARPGTLTEELPTLRCLGVRWLIAGDDNANATVAVEFRKTGDPEWRKGLDLFRVETRGIRSPIRPPAGTTLFAGSVFDLQENTAYEVRLSLKDPDGGDTQRLLKMTTWAEPKLPKGGRRIDVQPGGLRDALAKAQPGDTLLLHKGVYKGRFTMKSGLPGKPIALVGAGDGEAVIDGQGMNNCIDGAGRHDVMLERLSLRNAKWAISFNHGWNVTLRRCTITDCEYGFVSQSNGRTQRRILIADCTMRGPSTWPRTKGIENARAIQLSGTGHVVAYNRISGYADAIDTFSNYPCAAIDFHSNEISECTDDGIEMDYSEHNTRCFDNRLTNVFQGISIQPIFGGPVYVFRNALYNVGHEVFKMHNGPSGALFFHNTAVKAGMPLVLYTGEAVSNVRTRNNLFIGTTGNYGYESTARMRGCDFDYDGFAGQWKQFLKWNRIRYKTMDEARQKAPVYNHVVRIRPQGLFATGILPPADLKTRFKPAVNDLRLKDGCDAIDAGVPLANINDGFAGKAPDLGAYELGCKLPHYGPRPQAVP